MKTYPRLSRAIRLPVIAAILSGLTVLVHGQTITYLNETFSDGNRGTQNLPTSAAWVSSGSTANLTGTTGSMTLVSPGGSGSTVVSYFGTNAAGTTPVSLAVGDQLVASFNFNIGTAGAGGANSFRFGLYDSTGGAGRVSADLFGNSNAFFVGYAGYAVWTNFFSTAGNLDLRERDSTNNNLITGTSAVSLGTAALPATAPVAGTTYTASLTFTRSGDDQMDILFQLSGGALSDYTLTVSDLTGITSSFDTFVLFGNNALGSNIAYSNLKIDYIVAAAIPEPSTYALLLGGLALGGAMLHRRRRAA